MDPLLQIPLLFLKNLDNGWTFILLFTRFAAAFMLFPGLGGGFFGLAVRIPALVLLTGVSMLASKLQPVPADWGMLCAAITGEMLLGLLLGMIPMLIVSGAQLAGQLTSTSMGLGASQLIDPTSGGTVSELSRLYGDIVVIIFLLMGGHHVVINALSGLSGDIPPGTFFPGETSVSLIADRFGQVFKTGFIVSSPVVIALLLTQFVMGLLSKAVPSINIFIISFPLTVGIGLFLAGMALPSMSAYFQKEMTGIETTISAIKTDSLAKKTPNFLKP